MYATFFDGHGHVLQVPVPKGSLVTGSFYKEQVLENIIKMYEERRPRTGVWGLHLLHDNTPAHKSATVTNYLAEKDFNVIQHPHLTALCDFWLFPKLKQMLS